MDITTKSNNRKRFAIVAIKTHYFAILMRLEPILTYPTIRN